MKNKKRILLLSLSCALAFVIALCGFNAYANSIDAVSNIENFSGADLIQQQQYQRDGGDLIPKENTATASVVDLGKLYPAVYTNLDKADTANGGYPYWKNVEGAVDDIVCVKNIAEEAIYVRTVFAFEAGSATSIASLKENVLLNKNISTDLLWLEVNEFVPIDGQNYYICWATYKDSLEVGAETSPSLYQIALANNISKELYRSFGDQYDVKVVSQAATVMDHRIKTDSGESSQEMDAEAVLNLVHGEITATDHPWNP